MRKKGEYKYRRDYRMSSSDLSELGQRDPEKSLMQLPIKLYCRYKSS